MENAKGAGSDAGAHGDAVNVILVAAGHNIRLILRGLRVFYAVILATLPAEISERQIVATPSLAA